MNEPDRAGRMPNRRRSSRTTPDLSPERFRRAAGLDNHGIDDSADVVNSRVVDELHDAGIGVDFYFGDMGAAGKAKVDWIVVGLFLQPRLERLERIVVRHVGGECDVRER